MSGFWVGFVVLLVVVLVVAAGAIATAYARAMQRARTHLNSLGSQVLESDCGAIEYVQAGQGYPLLVVHGAMGGFDHGLWVAHGFMGKDYQLISMSRFGYLRSDLPANASLNLQADAFAHLLDALGIQKTAVFAVSAGSTSALRFVARYPERVTALVLVGPDSPGQDQVAMPPRFIYQAMLGSDLIFWGLGTFFRKQMQTIMGLVPKGFKLAPEHAVLIKQFLAGCLPVSQRLDGLMYESYAAMDEFNASVTDKSPYPLSLIKTPVLVVHALDDPLARAANVQALAGLLPNVERLAVPEGGHLFFGHMEEVTAKILQFMHSQVAEAQPVQRSSASSLP
jgi:pimeloyl-ACP methyl ester carboxylesterase